MVSEVFNRLGTFIALSSRMPTGHSMLRPAKPFGPHNRYGTYKTYKKCNDVIYNKLDTMGAQTCILRHP